MTDTNLFFHYEWQEPQWQRLVEQRENGKLPHALMLTGPAGIGKLRFAQAQARLLLCLSPRNGKACESCKSCELNKAGTHPDLYQLQPEGTSKVIKIDQVRQLTEFIAKTSQQGGMKLAIIEPVEQLNTNAANALLKSLEEPTGETLLLLVSHMPSQVMATVRSRCQKLAFPLPDYQQALSWLSPLATGVDPEYLLACAGGAPVAARELIDSDQLDVRQQLSQSLIAVAELQQMPLDVAAKLMKSEPIDTVQQLMQWVQMGIRQQADGNLKVDSVVLLLSEVPSAILFRFWDKLVTLKRQLLSSANPNKQLLLEEMLLDWQALAKQRTQLGQSRQRLVNQLT